MSERILNGDFSQGFLHWDNGVGGGDSYTLDVGRIKGSSYPENVFTKTYKIKQSFAVNDEVLTAAISIWAKWQAEAGDYNGKNIFGAVLKRPDMSEVSFLNLLKDGISGEGYLLSGFDLKPYFDQYGNYELCLTLGSNAKRDDESVSVTHPYGGWSNDGFTVYDGYNKIKVVSNPFDDSYVIANIEKHLTIDRPAETATITVKAKGVREHEICYVQVKVYLIKPDQSWETLYEGSVQTGDWETVLNNADIASHCQQVGRYTLRLYGKVRSYYESEVGWWRSEAHFDDVNLSVGWPEYTQSFGWYDNISLDMTVKKYKTVHEAIGGAESYSKFPKVSEQEIMQLSEAYNKLVKVKRFLEGVRLSETYEITAARNKEITEIVQLVESFFTKASFKRSKQESVVLAEMYEILKGGKKEVKELLGVSEDYSFLLRRAVSEIVELTESFNKKVSVSKSDIIRLAEDWSAKGLFHHAESEIVKLAESYVYFKGFMREAAEAAKLKESLQAKRTHGNVETTYYIDLPTEWDGISPATTKWIKSKVERN